MRPLRQPQSRLAEKSRSSGILFGNRSERPSPAPCARASVRFEPTLNDPKAEARNAASASKATRNRRETANDILPAHRLRARQHPAIAVQSLWRRRPRRSRAPNQTTESAPECSSLFSPLHQTKAERKRNQGGHAQRK